MQVSVEETQGLERRMTVAVPSERIELEVNKRLQSLSRTAKLSGFRPGKVPMKVVENKYGKQVREEVLDEVTSSTLHEAITQEKLRLAGRPSIESRSSESGKGLEYTAVFEVFPRIELASLANVTIEKPVAEITDQDVDNMLETMRKQRTEWKVVERAGQAGDRLLIDFKGTSEGKEFDGNEGKQIPVELGSNSFLIKGFEEELFGLSAGDEKILDLIFPDEFNDQALAGKPVQFVVKVHNVAEAQLPEIDDAFAQSFGVENADIAKLREEVRKSMQTEMDQVLKDKLKQEVMDALHKENSIDLPSALVEEDINSLMAQARSTLGQQGVDAEGLDLDRSVFEARAQRRVGLSLIIAEIANMNDLRPKPEQVRAAVENLASTYDDPGEVVKWYYADKNRLANIETLVLEDLVVDWVMQQATAKEQKTTFDALMKQRQA